MIPQKMIAAVLHGPKELSVEEVDVPTPAPGEVLIEVAANGLCHTDVTYYSAQIPEKMRIYPLILGHEAAGKVVALGEGVKNLKEGDNVLLPPVYGCGGCDYCLAGLDNLCRKSIMLGGTRNGAYAQYIAIPSQFAFKMSPKVDLDRACTAADAVSTVFYALRERVQMRPGDSVAVFGAGGLGLAALNVAGALGAAKLYAGYRGIGAQFFSLLLDEANAATLRLGLSGRQLEGVLGEYIAGVLGRRIGVAQRDA